MRSWRGQPVIKVITGVRRCGKSTLFRLFIDELLASGVKQKQIISINLEELEFEDLLDYHALYEYIKQRICSKEGTYLFIDEIQNCKNFEKAIDSLFVKENIDIYITGSNAYLLSGELATLLSGRYIQIEILPLSFAEYLCFVGDDGRTAAALFGDYLKNGAFPAVAAFNNAENLVNSYLDGVYHSILLKDVATRLGILDVTVLEDIANFLFSAVGSPVSVKKITDTINSAGRTISINTVDRYLRALCDSFLFYRLGRYDIKGRQHLKTQGKFYAVDIGLRQRRLASSTPDIGRLLENIVCLELMRRGNRLSIGKLAEREVDFVAENAEGTSSYQVSATVLEESTRKRELEVLQKIPDHHPKLLLTLDEIPHTANYEGIQQMNIIHWLLDTG
jgi:predicted AAA+ superfamily ATPase